MKFELEMIDLISKSFRYNEEFHIWAQEDRCDFSYSDGDSFEENLLSIVCAAEDISLFSSELRSHCHDWPSYYHLHPTRSNVIRIFEKHLAGSILEIGAGCGAITRFLGETGAQVFAVEGSQTRARIAAARTRDQDNVKVINADFNEIDLGSEFDVVLLVGVLEYAAIYNPTPDAYIELLNKAKSHLGPNGLIIVAIENQLGLKYFAGSPEDHVNETMFGIQDFYEKGGVRTFGLKDLNAKFKSAGFPEVYCVFPFPDYKFPRLTLRPECLHPSIKMKASDLIRQVISSDMQINPTKMHFSMEAAFGVLERNGLIADLSNSFLAVSSKNPEVVKDISRESILAEYYSTNRQSAYCKVTRFYSQHDCVNVSAQMLYPEDFPTTGGSQFSYVKCERAVEYAAGGLLSSDFHNVIHKHGWKISDIACILSEHLNFIYYQANGHIPQLNLDLKNKIPGKFIDAVPINVIRSDSGLILIDQEWARKEDISFLYLLFRSILVLFRCSSFIGRPSDNAFRNQFAVHSALFEHFGHRLSQADVTNFLDIEAQFMSEVLGYLVSPEPVEQWSEFLYPCAEDDSATLVQSLRMHVSDLQNLAERYINQIRWLESENDRRVAQEVEMKRQFQDLKSSSYDEVTAHSKNRAALIQENNKLKVMLADYLLTTQGPSE